MKLWWCVECEQLVGLSEHGRCEICESEAVDLIATESDLSHPVSATNGD